MVSGPGHDLSLGLHVENLRRSVGDELAEAIIKEHETWWWHDPTPQEAKQ